MKYLEHTLTIDETDFKPYYVLSVYLDVELVQERQTVLSRGEQVIEYGNMMLDVLDTMKNRKATNEIQETPASAIKDAITKG